MTFLCLVLTVNSQYRYSPKTLRFGPKLMASISVKWKFVWAPMQSGKGLTEATSVKYAPPALRKATVCKMMATHSAPGQVGDPPTMNSDAALGLSCPGYQGAETVCNYCYADGPVVQGITSRLLRRGRLRVGPPFVLVRLCVTLTTPGSHGRST